MPRIRTALFIALPILAACSEHLPTATRVSVITHPSAKAALAASPVRPFGGTCETDIAILPPVPSDPPNVLRIHIESLCQLKHLGRSTAITEQIVVFTGPTTAIASNSTTYTAANGDQLFATWTGTSTSVGADITFSGPETYTGGTGRFVAASGSATIAGTASFLTNTGQFTSVGTLSY